MTDPFLFMYVYCSSRNPITAGTSIFHFNKHQVFPVSGYQIEIVKSTSKRADHFRGLNYDYMMNYIRNNNEELLHTFYELRGWDKNGKKCSMAAAASYGEIKMWFLEQFPEIEDMANNVNRIVEEARKAREARKNAA